MITASGLTSELIAAKKDSSDPFHDLVEIISLFNLDYDSVPGKFVYEAKSDTLFRQEVDFDTAKAIGASGRFELIGYPCYLMLTETEWSSGTVPSAWPNSTDANGNPLGWPDYVLGTLVWEDFVDGGVPVKTFGNLSAANRQMFSASKLAALEAALPVGGELISTEERLALETSTP